jgi:hypothetical protein
VHVALLTGSTDYCSFRDKLMVFAPYREHGWEVHPALLAGDGIPHQEIVQRRVEKKDTTEAAA